MTSGLRKIIHVDMDAFYASIEQRDRPELRGQPVVVGGSPQSRGVVATASYEARKFGIRSAMSCSQAYKLCPHAIFVSPRFEVYEQVSQQIHQIFLQYTDLMEPLALDEAFLDVTVNKKGEQYATRLAVQIRDQIFQETRLTASAGVSFNKFLAKLASGWRKPNGLTVITPERAAAFIETLPIGRFFGVGKVTEKRMKSFGIHVGGDLIRLGRDWLFAHFGRMGLFFHDLAISEDHREVNPSRIRKSIGKETTFAQDILSIEELKHVLNNLCREVEATLEEYQMCGRTVQLKVRYRDFKTVTRSCTLTSPITGYAEIYFVASGLLTKTEAGKIPIRLLGVSLSTLEHNMSK